MLKDINCNLPLAPTISDVEQPSRINAVRTILLKSTPGAMIANVSCSITDDEDKEPIELGPGEQLEQDERSLKVSTAEWLPVAPIFD